MYLPINTGTHLIPIFPQILKLVNDEKILLIRLKFRSRLHNNFIMRRNLFLPCQYSRLLAWARFLQKWMIIINNIIYCNQLTFQPKLQAKEAIIKLPYSHSPNHPLTSPPFFYSLFSPPSWPSLFKLCAHQHPLLSPSPLSHSPFLSLFYFLAHSFTIFRFI